MFVGVRECVDSISSIGLRPLVCGDRCVGVGRVMVSTLVVGSAFSLSVLMIEVSLCVAEGVLGNEVEGRWWIGLRELVERK